MEPRDRYQHDPVFRQLVDLFQHYLEENACRQFTPTELREAVMLAATMYEYRHIRTIAIDPTTLKVIGQEPAIFSRPSKHQNKRIRIKKGWHDEGKTGVCVGPDADINGQAWTPVLWDGEEDPDFHKAHSLERVKE
jgi:hypothetical protein